MRLDFVESLYLPHFVQQRQSETTIAAFRRQLVQGLQRKVILDQLRISIKLRRSTGKTKTAWQKAANSPAGADC
eukprot:3550565-Pyramimonas_sp.AAC.1